VKKLIAAFKYLTIWGRFTALSPQAETVGTAFFFPLVGLALGLILALMNYLLAPYLDLEILSVALVAAQIIMTGGIHLEGLRRTFDPTITLGAKDQIGSTLGLIAVVLVILFKLAAIDSMDEKLTLSLLLTSVLARWAFVIFLYGCDHRCDEKARLIAANVSLWQLILATAATLVLTVYFLGRKGLLIGFFVSLFALLARSLLYRRYSLLTGDNFGAVIELSEVVSLILLASL